MYYTYSEDYISIGSIQTILWKISHCEEKQSCGNI